MEISAYNRAMILRARWIAVFIVAMLSSAMGQVSRSDLFAEAGAIRIHVREVRTGDVRGCRERGRKVLIEEVVKFCVDKVTEADHR
jgi:hypothetical protein